MPTEQCRLDLKLMTNTSTLHYAFELHVNFLFSNHQIGAPYQRELSSLGMLYQKDCSTFCESHLKCLGFAVGFVGRQDYSDLSVDKKSIWAAIQRQLNVHP